MPNRHDSRRTYLKCRTYSRIKRGRGQRTRFSSDQIFRATINTDNFHWITTDTDTSQKPQKIFQQIAEKIAKMNFAIPPKKIMQQFEKTAATSIFWAKIGKFRRAATRLRLQKHDLAQMYKTLRRPCQQCVQKDKHTRTHAPKTGQPTVRHICAQVNKTLGWQRERKTDKNRKKNISTAGTRASQSCAEETVLRPIHTDPRTGSSNLCQRPKYEQSNTTKHVEIREHTDLSLYEDLCAPPVAFANVEGCLGVAAARFSPSKVHPLVFGRRVQR